MSTRSRILFPLLFLTISMIAPSILIAQDDEAAAQSDTYDQAREILEDAAAALIAIPGFTADVTLSGEGSAIIQETLPSMSARFTTGTHPEFGTVIHMIGELRPTTKAPPESFDIVYSADRYIWADHAKQTINIRPPSVSARLRPTVYSYLLLADLISDSPFQKELNTAEDLTLEDQQSVGNALCNVVLITRANPKAGARHTGAHTKERWFIGTEDNLPRRVEQITDSSMINASLIMELKSLSIQDVPAPDLDVFRPESYKVSDNTRRAKPTKPDQDQPFNKPVRETNPQPTQPAQPITPSDPPAPNYSFTDINGATISRTTQTGRITVLYFFGSWSIPSNKATPLVSTLATDFAGQPTTPVDTYAIAVRESDPSALKANHQTNAYAQQLAINPPNTLVPLFQVRVFPTIIVIDDTSRIIYKEHLNKDLDAQALIDGAKSAINEALAESAQTP